jgi:hypothetical protein
MAAECGAAGGVEGAHLAGAQHPAPGGPAAAATSRRVTAGDPGPVLITGLDHSGKTPLRVALEQLPELALVRRAYLWTWFDGRFGPLDLRENLVRCLRAMAAHRPIAALQLDLDEIGERFASGEASYDRLFALVGEAVARRAGRPRWGIQESGLERHADRILGNLPGATFLHLVRDPRTWYAGVRAEAGARRRGGVGVASEVWRRSAALGLRNAQRYPARYLLVRYEELAADPTRALDAVSRELGIEPNDALRDAGRRLRLDPPPTLAPQLAAYLEASAGEQMARLGYHGAAPLRGVDRLRFQLGTRPAGQLMALAWRAAERAGPGLSQLAGRGPGRKVNAS